MEGHWEIENRLHWIRDVTYDEDGSQVRAGHIAQVMAAFRNAAVSVMRLMEATNIAAACRRYAAQPALALAAVGLDPGELIDSGDVRYRLGCPGSQLLS